MTNHDKLIIAFNEVYENEIAELKAAGTEQWEFTEDYGFERKMQRLIKQQRRSYWKYINTIGKKVAVILVLIAVTFSSAMTVPAFREPVIEFVVKTYKEFSSYFVDRYSLEASPQTVPQQIDTVYFPTEIPEDFKLTKKSVNNSFCYASWVNSENQLIEYSQDLIESQSNLNTENATVKTITICGKDCYTYINNGERLYLWVENGYSFYIKVPEGFTAEQTETIINSIQEKDNS